MSPPASDVGKKALTALRWAATARLAGQAFSWALTIVVIRLLSPADYGLIAMAMILPSALYLINDLGLDVVLVQNQSPDQVYTVAQDLATMPMHRAAGFINSIGLPAFSHVQDRLADVRFYLLKVTRIMSVMSFPLFVGLAVVAPEAVALLLGPKWPAAAPILQALALIMPLRMLATLLPPVLWGISRPSISAGNGWIVVVVVVGACLLGAPWGAMGMAGAWLAAYPVAFLITLGRTATVIGLRVQDFAAAMLWPAVASGLMVGTVTAARGIVPADAPPGLALLVLVPIGAITYVAVLLATHRAALRETLALISR